MQRQKYSECRLHFDPSERPGYVRCKICKFEYVEAVGSMSRHLGWHLKQNDPGSVRLRKLYHPKRCPHPPRSAQSHKAERAAFESEIRCVSSTLVSAPPPDQEHSHGPKTSLPFQTFVNPAVSPLADVVPPFSRAQAFEASSPSPCVIDVLEFNWVWKLFL